MVPEVGHFALILSMVLALMQAVVPLAAVRRSDPALLAFAGQAALGQLAFLAIAFGCLTYAFVASDFSVAVVAGTDALGRRGEEKGAERANSPPPELNARVSGDAVVGATDRISKIRGMVDGLAARVTRSPRDPEGWIELIRSWTLLHETAAAQQALDRAFVIFSDSPQDQRRIAAAAEEFGLTH